MALTTTGMELASEMVVHASILGLAIDEVPVRLHKDGRTRPPHLRSWCDGWRHLRFLLLYSPTWLFFVPGLTCLLFLASAFLGWRHVAFGALDPRVTMREAIPAIVMLTLGVQTAFASFFVSVLGLRRPCEPRQFRDLSRIAAPLPKARQGP